MGSGGMESKSVGTLSRVVTQWGGVEQWIAGILMSFALILSFYSVVARYILHVPLDWSDEVSVYAIVWCSFFGISSLIKADENVRMDLFFQRFSEKRKNILNFYHTLLGLAFLLVVVWGGYLLVQNA